MSKDEEPPEEFNGITFIDCNISNNGKGGVKADSGNLKFINTKTNDNGGDGVALGKEAIATFEKHESKRNEGAGVSKEDKANIEPPAEKKWLDRLWLPLGIALFVAAVAVFIFQPWQQNIQSDTTQKLQQTEKLLNK